MYTCNLLSRFVLPSAVLLIFVYQFAGLRCHLDPVLCCESFLHVETFKCFIVLCTFLWGHESEHRGGTKVGKASFFGVFFALLISIEISAFVPFFEGVLKVEMVSDRSMSKHRINVFVISIKKPSQIIFLKTQPLLPSTEPVRTPTYCLESHCTHNHDCLLGNC
jgi:hypothetical protein